jgi:F0F1-type ATP synthase membrane subunit b/b'
MFELVKKIQVIIDAYHDNNEQLAKEIKRIVEEWGAEVNTYSMQYINEQIRNEVAAARSYAEKINKVYNQKLKVILEDVKEKVLPKLVTNVNRASDHAAKVNNALQFLMIEGEQITDESAYMILKDFIDDLDQMKLFKNVIGKKVELEDDWTGKSNFPKTFGKLNQVEMILNTINDMDVIANMLFIYPRENGETYIVNGQSYSVPNDSYEQMRDEANIKGYAKTIEEYVKKTPGIDQVTDQTEPETVEE